MSASALLLATGCTHRLTDFTVISTKNVPIGSHSMAMKKADKRVKAKDTAHTILFIPIGSPNMKEAIDKAIESYPGAIALADGVIKSSFWTCFLYGQSSYIVEGTPIYEAEEVEAAISHASAASSKQDSGSDEENFAMLFFHEVKKGDTLASVAESYGVTVRDLIKWNQLGSQDIVPGSKLRIMVK